MNDLELATQLTKGRAPHEVMAVLHAAHNGNLHTEEHSKQHPLSGFSLSPEEWQDFRAHVMDGGGVDDDGVPVGGSGKSLLEQTMHALFEDDQASFWPLMVHVFKHWLKRQGQITPLPNGGVRMNGGPRFPTP